MRRKNLLSAAVAVATAYRPRRLPRGPRLRAGEGAVCHLDSGSPKLFEPVPGARSNLAVAITTGGDRWCRAMGRNQRLDLPAIRDVLADFVPVP